VLQLWKPKARPAAAGGNLLLAKAAAIEAVAYWG
jgi:hypothetical protein